MMLLQFLIYTQYLNLKLKPLPFNSFSSTNFPEISLYNDQLH